MELIPMFIVALYEGTLHILQLLMSRIERIGVFEWFSNSQTSSQSMLRI